MKRLFILLFTAALSLTAFAQTSLQPTVRSANTYNSLTRQYVTLNLTNGGLGLAYHF